MPQVKFNSKEFYLACVTTKKSGEEDFIFPDAPQIHFGVSEFKSLTVGASERGFRGLSPDSMPYCEAGRNNMAIEYSLID